MKTLRLIFMAAAALLVASCDDDSMNIDKVRISGVYGFDHVKVEDRGDVYNLSWEPCTVSTDRSRAV